MAKIQPEMDEAQQEAREVLIQKMYEQYRPAHSTHGDDGYDEGKAYDAAEREYARYEGRNPRLNPEQLLENHNFEGARTYAINELSRLGLDSGKAQKELAATFRQMQSEQPSKTKAELLIESVTKIEERQQQSQSMGMGM